MKNYTGHFIIGASIIIASIIISLNINKKQISSVEDCYKKVYKETSKNNSDSWSAQVSRQRCR